MSTTSTALMTAEDLMNLPDDTFSGSDYLETQDILPGFRLPLDRIFGPPPGILKVSK
jgi:hypothetical protein